MATAHLIHGFLGVGKTTFARRLEGRFDHGLPLHGKARSGKVDYGGNPAHSLTAGVEAGVRTFPLSLRKASTEDRGRDY